MGKYPLPWLIFPLKTQSDHLDEARYRIQLQYARIGKRRCRQHSMPANASSPAASGPAGSHFEAQVGAAYLLALLTGSEPRGLPGTTIESIKLQRAAEGHPLDDVIIHAHDGRGSPAVLEVQVKRTISFTPTDDVFQKVIEQIARASQLPHFWTSRHELAIATARTSRKIDGAYQDVLTWARQLGDAATFFSRISRAGSANDDMRTFVSTFRTHLQNSRVPSDDDSVWRLLRRLQILVFDFTAQGSASEDLAKERAVRALHADDSARAGGLWSTLIELVLRSAASGGERKRGDLITELGSQGFRLAGERRYSTARAVLAEAARHALDDIADQVGGAKLTRHEFVTAIHAALDVGRYVEIRGDAGVGKSGLLKHFAEQTATEAPVIVLSPIRTTPRGWMAMRDVIGFDGTARELLTDLAGDGAAILFIDNLDFFKEDERTTVVDLVREVSNVPGFAVIATARRNSGVDEPSWLPADALRRLGSTDPIVIGEPSSAEVEEIRQAAPGLAFLLADSHPARNVARNLFRLDRLAAGAAPESMPRSEVDMALHWWETADGAPGQNQRERARVLRALAEQALVRAEPLEIKDQPDGAVNALIASETLRDLGGDRVSFRHDVLREWAIGSLLHVEPERIGQLPLARPASAALARGVELAARTAIERSGDSKAWESLLERLSGADVHGSWRRAALLALVRSEVSSELLTRAADYLLADRGALLRELIRVVIAVESEPAARLFASIGMDPAIIPTSLNVPSGPSWYRLIVWILRLGDKLPNAAIPDVVDLYAAWSSGMLGIDPLTPKLQARLLGWLNEIEAVRDNATLRDLREPFGGEIDYDRMRSLEADIRSAFMLFANRTPQLAADYLRHLGSRRRGEDAIHGILKFRGTLAQAAPAELADLTANALIRKPDQQDRLRRDEREEPFEYVDHYFLPASPSQGPFLDLLTHSPQHGLTLIRRLVDHAISFHSGGREPGADAITVVFCDGERSFPWQRSYYWSRDANGNYSVTSALMALEVWAHRQIEAGESFDSVLSDVLGPAGSPAAYLLIAVDLILSHWPKSRDSAIPFLASPELLSLDRERQLHDGFEYPDLFGLKALQKEPSGTASLADLKKRPSRKVSLEYPLGNIAVHGPAATREQLAELLRQMAERLGPPEPKSTMRDPRLMVVYALNLLDPANWQDATVTLRDGSTSSVRQYVSPEAERMHLEALQAESAPMNVDTNMQLALNAALDDRSRSSPEFAAAAVKWAQSTTDSQGSLDEARMRDQAIVAAAMIAMRDGDAELRASQVEWAREIFATVLGAKTDPAPRFRDGLQFNSAAIALVGTVYMAGERARPEQIQGILQVAAHGDPAAAHGLGPVADVLASIDERLLRAVLRCAFASCIQRRRSWDATDEERSSDRDQRRQKLDAVIDAEMAWLGGSGAEPEWPAFSDEEVRRRLHLRLPGSPAESPERVKRSPDEYANHQAAALWLRSANRLGDVSKHPWLRDIARVYNQWTMAANGVSFDRNEDIDNPPLEWNDAYFELLARTLAGLSIREIEQLALGPLISLPDEPFFDAVADFVRSVDAVYFDGQGITETAAVAVRAKLAERLMESSGWRWTVTRPSPSIERHIGSAIATLFFNQHGFVRPTKCYLLPPGIDRLLPFLPVLEQLARSGPSLSIAVFVMNLLEVSPRPGHLPFAVAAAKAWVDSYPGDTQFWISYGIGRRLCLWMEIVFGQDGTLLEEGKPLRIEVERIIAALVRVGVVEAGRIEQSLA